MLLFSLADNCRLYIMNDFLLVRWCRTIPSSVHARLPLQPVVSLMATKLWAYVSQNVVALGISVLKLEIL